MNKREWIQAFKNRITEEGQSKEVAESLADEIEFDPKTDDPVVLADEALESFTDGPTEEEEEDDDDEE